MRKEHYLVNLILLLAVHPFFVLAQETDWQPKSEKIVSIFAGDLDPQDPLPDYPRPQMTRENWINLNGLWEYAIRSKGEGKPNTFDGNILVPFAVESALSGVGEMVGKDQELWYKTSFEVDRSMRRGRLLLHFGAVDWEAEIFVNGNSVGMHQGGFDPFSFDIKDHLISGRNQELLVRVWDPTDDGPQPRGKQVNNPRGIWYTPVTGIWQTVWLEPVPEKYIAGLKITPDFDQGAIKITSEVRGKEDRQVLRVQALDNENIVAEAEGKAGEEITLSLDSPKHWSPGSPFLYEIRVSLTDGRRTLDEVESYTAIRKISMETDAEGTQRMMLNGKFLFQYGPLDQGWWPDGLYTAPTDEALLFDIIKTKEMGFNMIRKHVKVEPARWYYHCDREGVLVWQDMPSGDMGNRWEIRPGVYGKGTDKERTPDSEEVFRREWKAIMDANYHFPSIVVWVPFNEAWGQFKTEEIVEWTKAHDPTRLINSASGGNFTTAGEIMDLHNYPDPVMPDPRIWGQHQILVLGEFGGLGLPVEGHTWQEKDNWGYQSFENKEALANRYEKLIEDLIPFISKGLSAAVYTQTTDVEVEVNGLMTYDREVIKFDPSFLKNLHDKLYRETIPQ